jgi:predicted HAD superfamily hydrolase
MNNPGFSDSGVASLISTHDLISMDVFDTAILRAVSRPTDVFSLVKLKLMAGREALLYPESLDSFPTLRVEAEHRARVFKEKEQGTGEVTIDEIYQQLALLSRANSQWLAVLKETELDLEMHVAYPNPAAQKIWLKALEQQKKVVFCSDMYLPSRFIASLLEKCGYRGYDRLFVSCEHAKSKHEGTFWKHIAGEYGTTPHRILHIGDNEHSDCTMARRAGCTGLHLPLAPIFRETVIPTGGERPFYSRTAVSTIQGVLRRGALRAGSERRDPLERIGYNVFGPLFTGFLLWVATMARRSQPEKILLFARDMYFTHAYLPRFLQPLGIDVDLEYVYASRGALLLPSFTDFPLARLYHLFSGKSHQSVAAHLRRMGLSPDLLARAVQSSGFESLDDIVPNGEPRMHALLTRLFQPLLCESARQRPLVRRYLEPFVGDARRLMLVDVGWVGNMQASFLRILEPLTRNLRVQGYYVGIYGYARQNDYAGHTMEGWLTHYGQPEGMEDKVWWAGGTELLEFAMCAPHGTTLGYALTESGEVRPVLESSDADAEARALSARVQKGAGQFLEEYLDTYRSIPAVALTSRVWADEFYRLVTAPSLKEAELLGDLTHSDAAGDTQRRLPIAPRLRADGLRDISLSLKQSFWKAGFLVRNGLSGQQA